MSKAHFVISNDENVFNLHTGIGGQYGYHNSEKESIQEAKCWILLNFKWRIFLYPNAIIYRVGHVVQYLMFLVVLILNVNLLW